MEKSSSKKGAAATTQAAPGTQQFIENTTVKIQILSFNKKTNYLNVFKSALKCTSICSLKQVPKL
jgi:hypothetical protein